MQDSEFVFKVPRVKKRWQNLYCTETISELDDVWETSESRGRNSRMKSISVIDMSESQSYDQQLFMNEDMNISGSDGIEEAMKCISPKDTTLDCDFYFKQEPLVTMDEDGDDCFNVSQNIYTTALLNEFCLSPQRSDAIKSAECNYQNEPENIFLTSGSPSWQSLHNNSNQSWDIGGEKSPNTTMDECDLDLPQSPDILIVRDESMANADSPGSDVDWDSLTPPAARSPCDHTVPDLGDLNTLTPSDFLLYSGPFPAYQMGGDYISEQENIQDASRMHLPLTHQSTDHVVPEFYS